VTYAQVTRLLFEGTHVSGVEYIHDHQLKQAAASREVILCGGAINSPQTLLLSGIGPASQLEHFGIPVVVDLPGVGDNLQDHAMLAVHYARVQRAITENFLGGAAHQEYLQSQSGQFAANRTAGGAFVKTRPDLELPDMQLYVAPGDDAAAEADYGIYLSICRPKDRGTITLRSTNPFEHPVIQPNYLAREEDLQTFIDAVKLVRQLAGTSALAAILAREVEPGSAVQTDAEIAAWIRQALVTTWHYSGTCKMGVDPLAVVNPRLQVYGVTGLRVVDASIMPEVIGGNTNAPVIMIAEKAADLIREDGRR
jgi:choline dehydrogenase